MKNFYHYRLALSNCKIASLKFKVKDSSFVKTKTFIEPVTIKGLPKIYVIKHRREIVYVGITSQSITNRLRYGFAAEGKGGYYGYRWKDLQNEIDILIWCFHGKSLKYVESIEAEIVFAIRRDTGKWPSSQTEIHFHNVNDEKKEVAQLIYNQAKGV